LKLREKILKRIKALLSVTRAELMVCFPEHTPKQITSALYAMKESGEIKNIGSTNKAVYKIDHQYQPRSVPITDEIYSLLMVDELSTNEIATRLPNIEKRKIYNAIHALYTQNRISISHYTENDLRVYGVGSGSPSRLIQHKDRKVDVLRRLVPRLLGRDQDLLMGIIKDISR